jgi:putative acetyltransferase
VRFSGNRTLTTKVVHATKPEQIKDARAFFEEYVASLGIDLSFQDFEREVKELPGDYSEPKGCILLAFFDSDLAGCVALRSFLGTLRGIWCGKT